MNLNDPMDDILERLRTRWDKEMARRKGTRMDNKLSLLGKRAYPQEDTGGMFEEGWHSSHDPHRMANWLVTPMCGRVLSPQGLLTGAGFPPNDRLARLFACASARLVWGHITGRYKDNPELANAACNLLRKAVVTGEGFADTTMLLDVNPVSVRILCKTMASIESIVHPSEFDERDMACCCLAPENEFSLSLPIRIARCANLHIDSAQSELLRDIYGNPFDPLTFTALCPRCSESPGLWNRCSLCHGSGRIPDIPEWVHNTTVRTMAQDIYLRHDFASLSILADACEDFGCTDSRILAHLRRPGLCLAGLHDAMASHTLDCAGTGYFIPHVRGCHVLDLILGMRQT